MLIRFLPADTDLVRSGDVPRPLQTLRLILGSGPLRRTLYLTIIVALSVAVLPITAVASTGVLDVARSTAGILTAAYGLGGLAASGIITVRPPARRRRPLDDAARRGSRGSTHCGAIRRDLRACPALLRDSGSADSYFFAATLAARSEYAPAAAPGQVFVWVGALKITAGSAGTALDGALIGAALHLPLVLAATLTLIAVLVSVLDRRVRPG